jgi:precorrin-2 dehydrogenase / sirohydrochlorin ferrochelatase
VRPYPVMMNLEDKRVIVVGGGRVATRKVMGLLESGASVTVVSPKLEPELEGLAGERRIEWIPEPFEESVLDRYPQTTLVFGTTDRRDVNIRIYQSASDRKIPCNIADVPDLCTFIVPAVITQGDLMIAVSTGGASPALARRIRENLEQQYGPEYGEMTRLLGELRKMVLRGGNSSDENKKLFLEIVDSGILNALKEGDREQVLSILRDILPEDLDAQAAIEQRTAR